MQTLRTRSHAVVDQLPAAYDIAVTGGPVPHYPVTSGNRISVLPTSAAFREALLADAERAATTANLITYNWEDNGSGAEFADLLSRRVAAGEIHSLAVVDTLGSAGLNPRVSRRHTSAPLRVRAAGGDVIMRRPWAGGSISDHRKLYSFDGGKVSYIGLNLGAKYDTWGEVALRIEGPTAALVNAEIVRTARQLGAPIDDVQRATLHSSLASPRIAGDADAQLLVNIAEHRALTERWLDMVSTARGRVISATQFLTSSEATAALTDAHHGGADVQVISAVPHHLLPPPWLTISHLEDAQAGGVAVALDVVHANQHAKVLLADDEALVSSMPLSHMAFRRSDEAGIVTHDRQAVQAVEDALRGLAQGTATMDRVGARCPTLYRMMRDIFHLRF